MLVCQVFADSIIGVCAECQTDCTAEQIGVHLNSLKQGFCLFLSKTEFSLLWGPCWTEPCHIVQTSLEFTNLLILPSAEITGVCPVCLIKAKQNLVE